MSLGSKSFPVRRGRGEVEAVGGGEDGPVDGVVASRDRKKRAATVRYDRCFSGLELRLGPGPLREMDPGRLKSQIRRWARAVVSYARQLSFGSPRSSPRSAASPAKSAAATLPGKSGLGGGAAGEEPLT